jgi:manganese/zinc/iron transport system permease protein
MLVSLSADELWVLATCIVCSAACAIPGVFLMLGRKSLLADGISHSALAGISIAFVISGTRNPLYMLIGAMMSGLLTAWGSSVLAKRAHIKPDAALGIVFTTLFSIGVIIISAKARQIDLDPGCVLYGVPEFIPFHTSRIFDLDIPTSFIWLSGILITNLVLCLVFWKELKLVTFDPLLATTLGFNVSAIKYAMLFMTTATIVLSFEALGSILVVAILIAPAACAYLISNRLLTVVILAPLIGIVSSVLGFYGALALNTSVAGMIAVAAGMCVLIAMGSKRS